jgi:hypothetical protein
MQIDFKGDGKGKGKVFPVHAVKAYRGSGGIAPPILNLRTNGGQWWSLCLVSLAAGKSTKYLFNRKLDGPQSWFGRFGEQLNLLPVLLFRPKIVQTVA